MRGWLKKLLAIVYSDAIPNLSIPFDRNTAAKEQQVTWLGRYPQRPPSPPWEQGRR